MEADQMTDTAEQTYDFLVTAVCSFGHIHRATFKARNFVHAIQLASESLKVQFMGDTDSMIKDVYRLSTDTLGKAWRTQDAALYGIN